MADTPTPTADAMARDRVAVRMGIVPESLDQGWRMAQMMAQSSLVPLAFQNKAADILVAMQMGAEVGWRRCRRSNRSPSSTDVRASGAMVCWR